MKHLQRKDRPDDSQRRAPPRHRTARIPAEACTRSRDDHRGSRVHPACKTRPNASETYVKNRLGAQQFQEVAPDGNGNPMWSGELLGLLVNVRPVLFENELRGVIVDVFPSGTMTLEATADSVRRALVRNYGGPRV